MILSTTPQIEGHTIREYKGIVTGETIIGANMFKDLFAGIRDIVGGRAGAYEKVLSEAKDTSMQEMIQHAQAARLRFLPLYLRTERPDGQYAQLHALQTERDADDGYHQYQSCDEILQGYVQASEYDPDDVS